jgi:steroid 5-alpha reductase family enzyme
MDSITTLVVWVASALICYAIAEKKGKNKIVAIAMGLCFSLFAVLGYLLAKGSKEYQLQKAQERIDNLNK